MSSQILSISTIIIFALSISMAGSNAPPQPKHVQDEGLDSTPGLVAYTYFEMKQHFEEVPDDIATAVRLAFHHCIGGCDGCIALESNLNRGLKEYMLDQNSTWTRLSLSEAMSRSDFLTYSTYAALDVATDINNRDCGLTDPDCRMPEMEYSYKWGRTDCDSPDAPNTNDEAALNVPTSVLSADEQMTYYADEFGFDMPEVVALNGVHALGAAKANQTGHDGNFTEGAETKINNRYYKMMLDNSTVWEQVLSEPTEDNPNKPEWHWDGYSAGDGSQKIGMKLDTDFELFYDLQLVSEDGLAGCRPPNGIGEEELPLCPKYPTYEIARRYAQVGEGRAWWARDFAFVLDKMLLNKVDLSLLRDLN